MRASVMRARQQKQRSPQRGRPVTDPRIKSAVGALRADISVAELPPAPGGISATTQALTSA